MNTNTYPREMKIIGAIVLQLIVIFAIIIFKVSVLSGGTDIALRITPVDPRDPIRGDYVTFRLDISTVAVYPGEATFKNGQTVYVPLRQSGKYFVRSGLPVRNLPPSSLRDEDLVYLRGVVESGGVSDSGGSMSPPLLPNDPWDSGLSNQLTVKYGIEEYFIPEGRGQGVSFWNREAYARVAVDDRGNAVLKQLYVDDQPWP